MDVFLRWFGIPLLFLVITGPLAAIYFVKQVKYNRFRFLWAYLLGLAAITVVEGIFIAHTFAGFFPDIGCFTSLLTPLVAIFTFLVFRRPAKQGGMPAETTGLQDRWFLIGMILIPVLQLSAPVISFGYARTCDSQNRDIAPPIIAALQTYQKDTGSYPTDLKALMPQYLASIPARACPAPFFISTNPYETEHDNWGITYCSNSAKHETYLTVPIIGSDNLQIYNLAAGMWSSGSTFDGFCGR